MRPIDVKASTNTDYKVENNDKDPKFEGRDHMRISKYKKNFCKKFIL